MKKYNIAFMQDQHKKGMEGGIDFTTTFDQLCSINQELGQMNIELVKLNQQLIERLSLGSGDTRKPCFKVFVHGHNK